MCFAFVKFGQMAVAFPSVNYRVFNKLFHGIIVMLPLSFEQKKQIMESLNQALIFITYLKSYEYI